MKRKSIRSYLLVYYRGNSLPNPSINRLCLHGHFQLQFIRFPNLIQPQLQLLNISLRSEVPTTQVIQHVVRESNAHNIANI